MENSGLIATAAGDVSRRRLLQTALGGAAVLGLAGHPASAEDDQRLADLVSVSQVLCGGGKLSSDRAEMLLEMIDGNPDLRPGLDELITRLNNGEFASAGGAFPGSSVARAASDAILVFWYASEWEGDATWDRGSAYYGVVAWQAMYTSVWAVCKSFGVWEGDPDPATTASAGRGAV